MKNRTLFISLTLLVFIICYISPAFALFANDVDKAKDFMAAGMYPQAIELLNQRIIDKPTDSEAHFQLGICYINTGNYENADARFASAVRIDANYGYNIGGEYQKAGSAALNKGQVSQAQSLFTKAVVYQPDLKKEIASECFEAGNSYIDKNQRSSAERLFSTALSYDGKLSAKIEKVMSEYWKRTLQTVKSLPKDERTPYINEAKKYLSQREIDAIIPPPTWQTVFGPTKFTGNGMGENEFVTTVQCGKDYNNGDRIKIQGSRNDYLVWNDGKWQIPQKDGSYTVNPKSHKSGGAIGVRFPKGETFKISVDRYQ
jgi:tetratricopeptide (TPR) repeat protein